MFCQLRTAEHLNKPTGLQSVGLPINRVTTFGTNSPETHQQAIRSREQNNDPGQAYSRVASTSTGQKRTHALQSKLSLESSGHVCNFLATFLAEMMLHSVQAITAEA